MRYIVLDTETTGLSPSQGHKITEIGCLEIVNRQVTENIFHSYLNPERDIDEEAVKITGLTYDFLQDKPKFAEIVDKFMAYLQEQPTTLIIHNAEFDLGFLHHELNLAGHNINLEDNFRVIDTLTLAREMFPGQRNSLDALCKRLKVDNSNRNLHGALLDSELLAKVYLAMTAGQTSFDFDSRKTAAGEDASVGSSMSREGVGELKVILAGYDDTKKHQDFIKEITLS